MKTRICGFLFLLALRATAMLPVQAEEASWPPALTGLKDGLVVVSGDDLLQVPADVAAARERGEAVEFVVAKTPPTATFAFHDQLGAEAATRRLWSSWGDICVAKDGKAYCAIGDHGDDKGGDARCFLYQWDPQTRRLRQVVDMNQLVPPKAGRPAWSKVHAKIDEGPDGAIYFSCTLNDGNRAKDPKYAFDDELPGGQIYRYDPASNKAALYTNLPPRRCTATSLFDAQRGVWWCNLEAGEGNALWGLNLATKKPIFQGADGSLAFNRAFGLLNDGSILYNGATHIQRLDPATGKVSDLAPLPEKSPGMRCVSRPTKDGWVYGVTHATNTLFKLSIDKGELQLLGPSWLQGEYTSVCDLSPDERFLYYLPGAHGKAWKYGTPVVQYELASGRRKVLAFLASPTEKACGFVPAGTYGARLSAAGDTLYVNFNGHPTDALRPAKMKPIGFGLTAFAALAIPASER